MSAESVLTVLVVVAAAFGTAALSAVAGFGGVLLLRAVDPSTVRVFINRTSALRRSPVRRP
ncbi:MULTISPECIES: hypothetical protein [unclassified Streptomyces]|uniref:hypothetical protein n=1 Tax=unclassified Streptomyces TaxID=2593676 RepID=UPI002E157585|nr:MULTISPECIES: hypothetical protein [unclassified Streptomyces]WSP77280.1 hypothetical protein OG324_51435 [Streptomyces sp. NBC_01236]WTI33610.1 hypothetical protein OIC96_00545 [Streptomyces sp. NBC_00775]WUB32718.1 hypothetical protein OHA51_49190 [Streptomyces sp. NBC_00589]